MAKETRLAALLFRTHSTLVLLTVVVVALPLVGLVRARSLLTELQEIQLANIDAEEAIHRAAWRVEVAARGASRRCLADPAGDATLLLPPLKEAQRELEELLAKNGARAQPRLLRAAQGYRDLARGAQPAVTCQVLNAAAGARLLLDEELTNAWIDRLRELHGAVAESDRLARSSVASSTIAGLIFSVSGVLVAAYIANRAARRVTLPLAAASAVAVRLGRGDFSPVSVTSDLVELRALAEAIERMRHGLAAIERFKQQILAAVSHELHTPLGKLREALELLGDGTAGPLTPRQQRVVKLARDACAREERTVSELLDVSRLHSGQPLRAQAGCDVDEVLRAAIAREQAEGQARDVRLELTTDGAAPALTLDVPLVERAVANLLRNALSVSPPGGAVRLRRGVVERPEGRPGRFILIEVEDDGPGLPVALRADPFRAFESAAVGARGAGLGLGLALAREVACAHGGDLRVARSGPAGTCFALLLPVAEGHLRKGQPS